ncbi:MAG: AIPR family protein [Thermodesulfobacteriota bacterium]
MVTDYLSVIRNEVERISDQYGISNDNAFVVYIGSVLFDIDEDIAFQALIPSSGDKGIDFFYVDEDGERVLILQAKYSPEGTVNTKQSHFLTLTNGIDWLEQPEQVEIEGNPVLFDASHQFRAALDTGYRVEIFFVALGNENKNIKRNADVANGKFQNLRQNRHVTCLFRNKIIEYLEARTLVRERVPQCEIAIDNSRYYEQEGPYGRAAIFTVRGAELKRLYNEHGDLLFARNIRLYLGDKPGGVNWWMRSTLETVEHRGNFFAFNNGVTFAADSFEQNSGKVKLKNASIVNGCQTTGSLVRYLIDDATEVEVLLRVLSPPETLIDDVIRFTNSQNQVKIWEIRSQDQIQRRLESELNKFDPPYLYTTRRGVKSSLSSSEKKRFAIDDDARTLREIKHDELGQAIASLKGKPKAALKAKSEIFDQLYDMIFPKDITPEYVVFAWNAYEHAAQYYREKVKDEGTTKTQLSILRAAGKWYLLSSMGYLIQLRNGQEWSGRVKRESAASNTTRDRLRKYAEISTVLLLQAVEKILSSEKAPIGILVRRDDFMQTVYMEIKQLYDAYSPMSGWLDSTMPRLFDVAQAIKTTEKIKRKFPKS